MSTRQLYNFVIDATLTTPALVEAKLASLEANAGEEGEGEREEDAVFMQTWTPSSLSEVANCEGDQKMRAAGQREGAYSDAVAHLLGTKKESQEDNEDGASDEEEEEEEEKSKEGSAGGAPNGKAVRNRKGSGPANQIKRGTGKGVRGESAAGSSKPKPRPILLARPPEETKPKAEGESNESGSGKDDGTTMEMMITVNPTRMAQMTRTLAARDGNGTATQKDGCHLLAATPETSPNPPKRFVSWALFSLCSLFS